jgi:hypothetical protein
MSGGAKCDAEKGGMIVESGRWEIYFLQRSVEGHRRGIFSLCWVEIWFDGVRKSTQRVLSLWLPREAERFDFEVCAAPGLECGKAVSSHNRSSVAFLLYSSSCT